MMTDQELREKAIEEVAKKYGLPLKSVKQDVDNEAPDILVPLYFAERALRAEELLREMRGMHSGDLPELPKRIWVCREHPDQDNRCDWCIFVDAALNGGAS